MVQLAVSNELRRRGHVARVARSKLEVEERLDAFIEKGLKRPLLGRGVKSIATSADVAPSTLGGCCAAWAHQQHDRSPQTHSVLYETNPPWGPLI